MFGLTKGKKSIGFIVEGFIKAKDELNAFIEESREEIVKSQMKIGKADQKRIEEIKTANGKFDAVDNKESIKIAVAGEDIQEAKAWLKQIPSIK